MRAEVDFVKETWKVIRRAVVRGGGGSASWSARSPGNPRERTSSRRSRGLSGDLAGRGAWAGPAEALLRGRRGRTGRPPGLRPPASPVSAPAPTSWTSPRRATALPTGPAAAPGRLFFSAWCWWVSCGDPGRGRVQICHKGAPGRNRRREKARNTNDSLPVFRLDRGLCGRFGQSAAAGRPGRASAGRAAAAAFAPMTAVTTLTTPSGPRERRSGAGGARGRIPPPSPVPGGLAHPRAPPGRPRSFRERVGF